MANRFLQLQIAPSMIMCCVDFRYIQEIQRFVKRKFGIGAYYLKADAGGIKPLVDGPAAVRHWMLQNLGLAYSRQAVRNVFVFQHQDCLRYGGSAAFRSRQAEFIKHAGHLRQTMQQLHRIFPDLVIKAFYASQKQGHVIFAPVSEKR